MKDILIGIWIDSKIRERQFDMRVDEWIEAWMHKIEKEISLDELELAYERFVKRDNDHLYKGASVRLKRSLSEGDLWNEPSVGVPIRLPALIEGVIVDTRLDKDESDNGYFDCSVYFPEYGSWLMRVEWLEWECDQDDDES